MRWRPSARWGAGIAGVSSERLLELCQLFRGDLLEGIELDAGAEFSGWLSAQRQRYRALHVDTLRELTARSVDPLQFGMLASRAIAHVRLGELEDAARWALKASARPNAHVHILAIAAECLALSQRREEAQRFLEKIRARVPRYRVDDFLRSFHFSADLEQLFRSGAGHIGFD